jgi:hypothetical protein
MGRKYPAPVVPYVEAKNKGGKQTPTLIVLSSSWTTSEEGAALALANVMHKGDATKSSFHYVVDEKTTYQCVWDRVVAFHCGHDFDSIGIKMCDDPSLLLRRWNDKPHQKLLYRLADLTAQLCLSYNIPARYLTDEQLATWARHQWKSRGGIVTRSQMERVFDISVKQEPKDWPRYEFLSLVHNSIDKRRASK